MHFPEGRHLEVGDVHSLCGRARCRGDAGDGGCCVLIFLTRSGRPVHQRNQRAMMKNEKTKRKTFSSTHGIRVLEKHAPRFCGRREVVARRVGGAFVLQTQVVKYLVARRFLCRGVRVHIDTRGERLHHSGNESNGKTSAGDFLQ